MAIRVVRLPFATAAPPSQRRIVSVWNSHRQRKHHGLDRGDLLRASGATRGYLELPSQHAAQPRG
jgi:hypothetical protein